MDPIRIKKYKNAGPEHDIEKALMAYLKARDWLVIKTHGNELQMGLPDLYCAHKGIPGYGFMMQRWIEVKNPEKYHFTSAQQEVFRLMSAKGVGIWILCGADDHEYHKLFNPPNWHLFLGKSKISYRG